jgi:hypothetical protein
VDCLACGITSSSPSREHVFAQWLIRELNKAGISGIGLFRRIPGPEETVMLRLRPEIRLESFTLKGICAECNNGWMSQLEDCAKPLLMALMLGERELTSLEVAERNILARWTAKTAIIESHSVGAECPVDRKVLRWIRTHDDIPGRFAVTASATQFHAVGHLQVGIIRDLIGGGKASGNIILITLPRVAFTSAFPMLDEVPFDCRAAAPHQALWPDPLSWRPLKGPFGQLKLDNSEAFFELAERVELFHKL